MDKIYEYKTKQYNYKIRNIGLFAIFFLIYSIIRFVKSNLQIIYLVPIIVCIYIIWEDFISLSNPKIVHITDEFISFKQFSRTHTYYWKDIKRFSIKEFMSARKMYIRINDDNIFKGRYWVNCYFMNDTDEIYMWLRNKEMELNPNSVKTRSIISNQEEFEKRQKARAEKQAKKEKEKQEKKAAKEAKKAK